VLLVALEPNNASALGKPMQTTVLSSVTNKTSIKFIVLFTTLCKIDVSKITVSYEFSMKAKSRNGVTARV
jgi:hypothetical protein